MNKQLKKLVLAFTLTGAMVAGFGATAFADGKPHRGHGHYAKFANLSEAEKLEKLEARLDKRVAKMTQTLSLDAAQQVKVRQILADQQTQLIELYDKNKDADDKSAARGEARAIFKASRGQIAQVLTPEQIETYKQLKEQRKGKKGKRGKFQRGNGAD